MSAFGLLSSTFTSPEISVGRPAIIGLLGGVAEIGSTVFVQQFGQTPTGAIIWALNGTPISGATGTSLVVPEADGALLSASVEGEASFGQPVRYPAPVAAGQLTDQSFTAQSGMQTVSVAGDFTFSGTPLYTLRTGPAGVTVVTGTGLLQINTDVLPAQAGSSIVVRLADAGDPTRFAESGFSLTIDPAPSSTAWSFTGSTVAAIPDAAGWAFTGSTVTTIGDV